jgi:hypothetical protein
MCAKRVEVLYVLRWGNIVVFPDWISLLGGGSAITYPLLLVYFQAFEVSKAKNTIHKTLYAVFVVVYIYLVE